jgi:hypothetical protein
MYLCNGRLQNVQNNEGALVSVAIAWFNNCPFKASFPGNAKKHFIVASVYEVNKTTQLYEMQILGTISRADNFHLNEEVFNQCRQRWYDHGQRLLPHYEIGKKEHDFNVSFWPLFGKRDTPANKRGNSFVFVLSLKYYSKIHVTHCVIQRNKVNQPY